MSYFFTNHFRESLFDDPTVMDNATIRLKLFRVAPSLGSPAASQWPSASTMEELTQYIGWEEVIGIGGYPDDMAEQTVSVRTETNPDTGGVSHYVLFGEYPFTGLDEPALIEGFAIEYVGDLNGVDDALIFVTNTPVGTYLNLDPYDRLTANEDRRNLGLVSNRYLFSWADPAAEATTVNPLEGPIALLRAPPAFEASNTMHIWLYPQRANMIANPSFEYDASQWAPTATRVRDAPFLPTVKGEVEAPAELVLVDEPVVGDCYATEDDHIWKYIGPDPNDDITKWKDMGVPKGGGWCGSFTQEGPNPMAVESNVWETRMGHDDHEIWTFQLMAKGSGKLKVGLVSWDLDYRASNQDWGTEVWDLSPDGWTHVTCVRFGPQAHTAMMRVEVVDKNGESQELKLDKVLAERGALKEYPYFDGDETYGTMDDYSWYGGAGRRGVSYSMWYGGRRAVVGRLFATPTDTEAAEDVVTNVDVMAAGMVYEWVPAGVTVIPHLDVFYPSDLRGPLPPRRPDVLPPSSPDDPLGVNSPWTEDELPPPEPEAPADDTYPLQKDWFADEGTTFPYGTWVFNAITADLEGGGPIEYVITDQGVTVDGVLYAYGQVTKGGLGSDAPVTEYSMVAAFDVVDNGSVYPSFIGFDMTEDSEVLYPYAHVEFLFDMVSEGVPGVFARVVYDEASVYEVVPWTPIGTRIYLALTVTPDEIIAYAYDDEGGISWTFTPIATVIPAYLNQPGIQLGGGDGVYASYWTDEVIDEAAIRAIITDWGYGGGAAMEPSGPSVTIDLSGSQTDPTSDYEVFFTVEFSQPVDDFTSAAVTLGGTALPTTAFISGSGTSYEVAVSGMSVSGTVTASIPADVVHNDLGTGNDASTSTDNSMNWVKPYQLDAAIQALGPIGYWPLLETAGSTAEDISGNNRDGAYTGGTVTPASVAGDDGRMYPAFNGANQSGFIVGGHDNRWRWGDSGVGISWFFLARPITGAGQQSPTFIACGGNTASNKSWRMRAFDFQRVGVSCYTSGITTARQTLHATDNLVENSWRAYIGGIPSGTAAAVSIVNWVATTGGSTGSGSDAAYPLRVGHGFANMLSDAMTTAMAHVAVFPFVLNSTQIAALQAAAQADGWS